MNDIAATLDALLEWAYDQARGNTTTDVDITPFVENHQLDRDAGYTLADACERIGLAESVPTYGNAAIMLTAAGLAHVQDRRRRRDDPALRSAAARIALLRWMFHQHDAGVHMPAPSGFATTAEANYEGRAFSTVEIGRAADYLAQRGLIKGSGAFGHTGPIRAAITSDGMDCVVDWSADVSAYVRRHETGSTSTYNAPVFHGDANGAQLAWNNNSVTQTTTRIEQVAPGYEPLAQAMAEMMTLVSAMNLSPEAREDVEAASDEITAEIVRDQPRPGPIRRALTVLRTWLTPIAAAGAVGAGEGAQEAARRAIELIAPF